ncbi:MAG: hypothetical protein B6241_01725 [Spirochaetaceae bacterium 4572_59]|nr:MAG: hypothetical protein B6241_01725 [Spirochaetaceae bacterium 4572_59]
MNYEYITAIMLSKGSEAPLKAFLKTMDDQLSLSSPLPVIIPLAAYPAPFPPDRVDRGKLRKLESLSFSGLVSKEDGMILTLSDPTLIDRAADCLKGIHGKEKPAPLQNPLFSWKGLMLQPEGFPGYRKEISNLPPLPRMNWHTYRYVQLKISWMDNGAWWNHIEWEILWNIRKSRSAK